jgi:DNA-binding response OmpR family regulator
MTAPLNRLERMGWEVAAMTLLDIRPSEARMLAALVVDRPGAVRSHQFLIDLGGREDCLSNANLRASVRMSNVRRALMDVGFPGDVVQVIHGLGYLVPRPWARAIDASMRAGYVVEVSA